MRQPFEKWSHDQKTEFVMEFKKDYNKKNNEAYEITQDTLKEKPDYDFVLFKKNEKIKVQHTFAGAESEKEYVIPKLGNEIIASLIEKTKDLKNISVHLNIYNPPKKREEKDALVYWINDIIRLKVGRYNCLSYFSYDKEDAGYIERIKKYVDDFVVRQSESDKPIFSWSTSTKEFSAVLGEDIRFEMAVGSKEQKYSNPEDLVLIVDYNILGISENNYYIPIIKNNAKNSNFLQIWIHNGWGSEFIKIK